VREEEQEEEEGQGGGHKTATGSQRFDNSTKIDKSWPTSAFGSAFKHRPEKDRVSKCRAPNLTRAPPVARRVSACHPPPSVPPSR
jgi:hypothetical protein